MIRKRYDFDFISLAEADSHISNIVATRPELNTSQLLNNHQIKIA